MSKVKLDLAVQNLLSLHRRAKQTQNAIHTANLKAETIKKEVQSLQERYTKALADGLSACDALKGIEEYRDEIAQMVQKTFLGAYGR